MLRGIVRLDSERPDPAVLAEAAAVLERGGLVVIPTETLYGIAADMLNSSALERLAGLKGRDAAKPFPLILAERAEAANLTRELTPLARRLMDRHWPGALTLVLKARQKLCPRLVGSGGGVAVRLSSHPVAAGLAAALGRAITATSANPGGLPAPSRPLDLHPDIAAGVDLILDAGPTPGGPPSTLVDLTGGRPKVLRAGAVAVDWGANGGGPIGE